MLDRVTLISVFLYFWINIIACKKEHYANVCVHKDDCYIIKDTSSKYGLSNLKLGATLKFNEGCCSSSFIFNKEYSINVLTCNANEIKVLIDNDVSWKVYKHSLNKIQKQGDIGCTRLWLDTDKLVKYND
ncbi:hypothetical protein K502DRAFT_69159 [Neoconidiobolus thromboides FSU 785]|nr:hypothetical protein K502DRAFT_69159 [Neoconidiobolus thromboides FSU 785]